MMLRWRYQASDKMTNARYKAAMSQQKLTDIGCSEAPKASDNVVWKFLENCHLYMSLYRYGLEVTDKSPLAFTRPCVGLCAYLQPACWYACLCAGMCYACLCAGMCLHKPSHIYMS